MHLLCWNQVEDFDRWLEVFESHPAAHRAAGLVLVNLWRDTEDPKRAHFLFEVTDRARAQAFLAAPESAAAGKEAGVLDGGYHFLETVDRSSD